MSSRSRNSTLIQEYNFSFYIDKNNNNSRNNNNNNKTAKESQSNSQNQQHQHSQLHQTKPQSQSQIFHFHFRPTPTGTTGTASASHLTHSAATKTRPQSKGSRLHQILLTNQSSLNNIVFDTFSCDSNSSMSSYTRTPRTPRFTYNNEQGLSILVKKPFKHYVSSVKSAAISTTSSSTSNLKNTKSNSNDAINTSSNFEATISNTKFNSGTNEKNKIPNPSSTLILRTANVINEFADQFARSKIRSQSVKFTPIKKSRSFHYSGLRPLNYFVEQKGPSIKNCIGIIKEPKSKPRYNLKEIYEYKLQLLEQKNKAQAEALKVSSTHSLNTGKHLEDTNIEVINERGQLLHTASRRSSGVEVIKVTVEDIIKPNIPRQKAQFIQAAN